MKLVLGCIENFVDRLKDVERQNRVINIQSVSIQINHMIRSCCAGWIYNKFPREVMSHSINIV
jgi:hypothetical protein